MLMLESTSPAAGTVSLKKQVIVIDPQDLVATHDRDGKHVEASRAPPRTTSRA
jgi:hypothetical protein